MLRKSPTLAKNRKDGPPYLKAHACRSSVVNTVTNNSGVNALTVLDTIPKIYEVSHFTGLACRVLI